MELIEAELNSVKGLLHYFNGNLRPSSGSPVSVDAAVIDSNGETAGYIRLAASGEYAMVTV